ncbi:SelB C-terminal domain-containing protein, partial [Desulfovibrio sp. OttesenSCG-928-F20]|nr:SelB C-terminal domain-containing protein [Desulfovibrio sp. OttesenSCG-928-F20]
VSARTGEGLDLLAAQIERVALSLSPVRSRDLFRLPVDRVFTMRGHGTVMTGTMIGGSLLVGDAVELSPGGLRGKVRSLQSHGETVEKAPAGRRTAVNVPDFAVDEVRKGDVLALPDTLFPTLSWAVQLNCLSSSPRALRHRSEAHFHHGARDVQARIYLADRDKLQPGESCLARICLPEALAAVHGDHFVLRSFSPLRTVAGGVVLNPLGVDMRRRSKGFAERLELLRLLLPGAKATDEDRVHSQLLCTEGAQKGLSFAALRVLTNLENKALDKALAALASARRVLCFDREARLYIAYELASSLGAACIVAVKVFHAANPEKKGVKKSELLSGWGRELAPKLAHAVIELLVKQGTLQAEADTLRLPTHEAAFSREQAPLGEALLKAHREAALAPPNLVDVLTALGATKKEAAPVLAALRQSGDLVRVAEGLWYAGEHIRALEKTLHDWFAANESIDLAAFKNLTGLSRKYLVALLEYFDDQKLTMRLGDVRVLRKKT